MTQKAARSFDINEYLFMLSKHKLLIIFCFILGLTAAFVMVKQTVPGYKATARLTIQPISVKAASSFTEGSGAVDSLFFQELNVNTHIQLMHSRPVLERLIAVLHLDQEDIREQGVLRQIAQQIRSNLNLITGTTRPLTPAEQHLQLLEGLRNKISLNTVRFTNILEIVVHDADPKMARDIANTLAEIYIQQDISNNQQAALASFTFLRDQAAEFKEKLDAAEKAFLAYKQKENLFSLTGLQENIASNIKEYDIMLIETRSTQHQLSQRLQQLESLAGDKKNYATRLRSLLSNPVVDNLSSKLIAAEMEQSRLSKIYRSKHAEMQAIESSINDLQQEIGRQIERELANMRQERTLLQAREKNLGNMINELKKEAMDLSSKEQEYLLLERNVEAYRRYHENIIAKIEEAALSSEIRNTVTSINFVERAEAPLHPISPDRRKIFLAGIFGGLCMGLGLAFLLEFSDRSIRTEEDVRVYFDLPVMGVIPIMGKQSLLQKNYIPLQEKMQEAA